MVAVTFKMARAAQADSITIFQNNGKAVAVAERCCGRSSKRDSDGFELPASDTFTHLCEYFDDHADDPSIVCCTTDDSQFSGKKNPFPSEAPLLHVSSPS